MLNVKRVVWLILVGISLLGSAEARAEESRPPLSRLIEGRWVAVEGISNGEPAPPDALASFILEFRDGFYHFKDFVPVRYTVDDSQNPAWVDIHNSLGQVGIAEIKDGMLRLCFGVQGDRPREFKTAPHTDRTYLRLKREKR